MATMVAVALALSLADASGAVGSARPGAPQHGSFYRYDGSQALSRIKPGTVLKSRHIPLAVGPITTPVMVTQLLYRTTDQRGRPTATVTTVIDPLPVPAVPRIVGYLSFYDDLGGRCAPSYTLAGGDPGGGANQSQAEEEELLIAFYVANGWIVTVPDFEGSHLHWMAGRESGQATLDGIRATESALGLGATTQVALSGYSGGAVAADWAAEIAPRYAPELTLTAVAMGGVPVDYAHLFAYANGSKVFSAAMPGILLGLARAYGLPLDRYLSPYGRRLLRAESTQCMTSVFGDYPGLTYQRLFKARYRNPFKIRRLAQIFNDQIMGRRPGSPHVPLMIGNGDVDGFGDGVMRLGDAETLARQYCRQNVAVEFHRYGGAGHETAGADFEPETALFFQGRFNGLPFKGNCGSIPTGSSLKPLPVPKRGGRR
jgi:hypothetical protein